MQRDTSAKDCPKPDIGQRLVITFWVLLTNSVGLGTFDGNSPTMMGYAIHALVFGLLVFGSTYLTLPSV